MENELLLQADIESVTEKTITFEKHPAIEENYTLPNTPRLPFKEIKDLISEKPLHPIERSPFST